MKEWSVSGIDGGVTLGEIEIEKPDGLESFWVMEMPDRLVFGGAVNVGFLESGYILREDWESVDETLQELVADLEVFYRDGREHCSRIVCNERM